MGPSLSCFSGSGQVTDSPLLGCLGAMQAGSVCYYSFVGSNTLYPFFFNLLQQKVGEPWLGGSRCTDIGPPFDDSATPGKARNLTKPLDVFLCHL